MGDVWLAEIRSQEVVAAWHVRDRGRQSPHGDVDDVIQGRVALPPVCSLYPGLEGLEQRTRYEYAVSEESLRRTSSSLRCLVYRFDGPSPTP